MVNKKVQRVENGTEAENIRLGATGFLLHNFRSGKSVGSREGESSIESLGFWTAETHIHQDTVERAVCVPEPDSFGVNVKVSEALLVQIGHTRAEPVHDFQAFSVVQSFVGGGADSAL